MFVDYFEMFTKEYSFSQCDEWIRHTLCLNIQIQIFKQFEFTFYFLTQSVVITGVFHDTRHFPDLGVVVQAILISLLSVDIPAREHRILLDEAALVVFPVTLFNCFWNRL